jgi:hypothetical protein
MFAMFALGGSVVAASLQMETDEKFRASAESYLPGAVLPVFNTIGSTMRSVGIVDLLGKKPPAPTMQVSPKKEVELREEPEQVIVEESSKEAESDALPEAVAAEEGQAAQDVEASPTEHADADASAPVEEPTAAEIYESAAADVEAASEPSVAHAPAPAPVVVAEPSAPTPAPVLPVAPSVSHELEAQYKNDSDNFRRELERHYLAGIDELDAEALAKRMRALVTDYADRSKWEAVRLHQSIRHVEKELAEHYSSAIAKEHAERELRTERELAKRETDVRIEMSHIINDLREAQEFRIQDALKSQERSLQSAFDKQKESIEEAVKEEAERDHQADLATFKMGQMNKMLELHRAVEDAHGHVAYFDKMAQDIIDGKRHSARVHEESAAILALEAAMSSSKPIVREVDAVRKVCDPGSMVATLLDSLPQNVCKAGAPTMSELRARFSVAKEEARKAALAPQNAPKMIGQMIGSTLAALLWEVEGNVSGESEEAVLARASFYLDNGSLKPAYEQLSVLKGYPKTLMKDWETSAHQRLVVDQTLTSLKAAVALEHLERHN